MVTVADLAEKYWNQKIDNKKFCSELGLLYRKQFDEKRITEILKSLKVEAQKAKIK